MNQHKTLNLSNLHTKEERTAELYVFLRGVFPAQPCNDTIVAVEELERATRVECSSNILSKLLKENRSLLSEVEQLKARASDHLAAQYEASQLTRTLKYIYARAALLVVASCVVTACLTSLIGS